METADEAARWRMRWLWCWAELVSGRKQIGTCLAKGVLKWRLILLGRNKGPIPWECVKDRMKIGDEGLNHHDVKGMMGVDRRMKKKKRKGNRWKLQ